MQPSRSTVMFTWRGVSARVGITRNHRIEGWTLLTVDVVAPARAPLPFAVDGRLIHGLEQEQLDAAGGVQRFLAAWADREARSPAYLSAVANWKQGDLFR